MRREGGRSARVRPAAMMRRTVASLCAIAASLACLLQAGCEEWTFPPLGTGTIHVSASATTGGTAAAASPSPEASASAAETPPPTPAPEETPTPAPATSPPQSEITVRMEHLTASDEVVEIDLEYPVVSGMADVGFEAALNDSVLADMRAQADQLREDAVAASGDLLEGEEYQKFTLESETELEYKSEALFSLSISLYAYTGGAHGNSDSRYYNVLNTVPARRLSLPDLFADRSAGLSRVQDTVDAAIAADSDDYFDPPGATVGEDTWFYLTNTGLYVVFPAYTIAPGVMGEPEFHIALGDLEGLLIPELG
jgi:hypothetical protein